MQITTWGNLANLYGVPPHEGTLSVSVNGTPAAFTMQGSDAFSLDVPVEGTDSVEVTLTAAQFPYNELAFDDAGNIIANVNHRTGNLGDLLLVTGGAGEVAVAEDTKSLVIYGGVALDAVELANVIKAVAAARLGIFGQAVTTGTTGEVLAFTENYDPSGLYNSATSQASNTGSLIALNVSVAFSGSTAGTHRTLYLEDAAGTPVDGIVFPASSVTEQFTFYATIASGYRIRCLHDAGVDVTVKGSLLATVYR